MLKRTNEQWLADLRDLGEAQGAALDDLRQVILARRAGVMPLLCWIEIADMVPPLESERIEIGYRSSITETTLATRFLPGTFQGQSR
jgi:hypothetical protein